MKKKDTNKVFNNTEYWLVRADGSAILIFTKTENMFDN